METLDMIFAKAAQLSDEEFDVLMGAMQREKQDREKRVRCAAWTRVTDAIADYIREYGSIIITDNRDGDGVVLEHGIWTASSLGLIEIE